MQNPQIGQRWLVDTDASLGLGIITGCEGRRLTLEFPATGDVRQYSRQNAPLTRAVFAEGDTVEMVDGSQHQVARVESINDLLIYISTNGDPLPESQLAATIQFNHPLKRLLAAQLDKPNWFDVREQLARAYQQWLRSDLIGLLGARITLTPHQLYVAWSATSRTPVRILLADEVGLGKTIEAGLILQRLQLQQQVSRTLILVPEALCVQWFVELLRCFSMHAVLVDADTELNELNDSRIFIAAHGFIDDEKALAADAWDMLVVYEAHHFDLVDDNSSGQQLKHLAAHSTHLLLLSATPERLGLASHFSRLQLLDAEKFYSFDDFKRAYDNYQTLANDLQALLDSDSDSLTEVQLATLQAHFQVGFEAGMTKAAVMELLLDSLGTGRMIYRNTRHGVAGFPKRQLVTHQLADNEAKLAWLADFVKQHKDEKLLLITHQQEDVLDLKVWLYRKAGIDCPVFHEDMTLIERDRAAAYFADSDEGAPLLLCSEIGSEGRNFQFCHRLICWDLPDHPDVLEQRIGRLDRIGQKKNIEIHVCVESEASAKRLYWFHDVLGSIEQINPAAGLIHDQWYSEYCDNPQAVEPKIKSELHALLQQLEQGRDRLLEMNSCRQPDAAHLVAKIQQLEADSHPQELLESIVDVLNIHYEQLDSDYFRLVPSDQMLVPMIPGIPAEGCEITFDRKAATAREEVEFITWDHPLMQGLAEMITQSELGVASVGLLPNKTLRPGMLFVEVLFTLSLQSEYTQHVERYLTQSGLRIVVTKENANNLSAALPSDKLSWLVESASKAIRHAVVKDYRKLIDELVDKANQLANAEMATIVSDSLRQLNQRSQLELARLTQLQQRNAAISDDSIVALREHYQTIAGALEAHCQPVVSAIRLLVTYRPETE